MQELVFIALFCLVNTKVYLVEMEKKPSVPAYQVWCDFKRESLKKLLNAEDIFVLFEERKTAKL